jgi:hypothetical protein
MPCSRVPLHVGESARNVIASWISDKHRIFKANGKSLRIMNLPRWSKTGQWKANKKPILHHPHIQALTTILAKELAFFGNSSKTGQKSTKKANPPLGLQPLIPQYRTGVFSGWKPRITDVSLGPSYHLE